MVLLLNGLRPAWVYGAQRTTACLRGEPKSEKTVKGLREKEAEVGWDLRKNPSRKAEPEPLWKLQNIIARERITTLKFQY